MLLTVKSKIAEWQLSPGTGTIITGSPRSGTTLALRVYCPDLSAAEEKEGSLFNEPQPLCGEIIQGELKKVLLRLPLAMNNRHQLIKSPQMAVVLPYIKAKYRVIVTYRDLRLLLPSMMSHHDTPHSELAVNPYWTRYAQRQASGDLMERAIATSEQFYMSILGYKGPLVVWNYGFWGEWVVRSKQISHLYERKRETSSAVLQDIAEGKMFSDKGFMFDGWKKFCDEHRINKAKEDAVGEVNRRIQKLYKRRGFVLKTLDDL